MALRFSIHLTAAAAMGYCGITAVSAQTPGDATTLPTVTVSSRPATVASIGGWGDLPLSKIPMQASVYDQDVLKDYNIQRLADLTKLDPAISDAYNAVGYWDAITLRGFVIDNRFNFRRDGLPINAETAIPLDNKDRIEVLKGISGMQAGTSAPGGLVNYVVKRPTAEPLHMGWAQVESGGSVLAAVDLSQRFGEQNAFGLRMNAAYEQLRPNVDDADGNRYVFALAGDWRLAPGSLLEAEFETSRHSQPSVPAFSLLGSNVPAPVDPKINLNNQPWSLPVVFNADTGSVRFTQAIDSNWNWSAQGLVQQLRTDDRVAFPYGCSAEGKFDRYCSDGTFDMYDYRSENERRRSGAVELALHGRLRTGSVGHALTGGVLWTQFRSTFQRLAYNWVGIGNVDGSAVLPADPSLTDENTNRTENSTELFLRDALQIADRMGLWIGLRHTSLHRKSVRTDGSQPTDYTQSFNSPWLAASYQLDADQMLYASWGRGIESEVTPNRSDRYINAGEALPVLSSQQFELGWKGERDNVTWSVAAFDVTRPAFADILVVPTCDPSIDNCLYRHQADGSARHTGIEAAGSLRSGAWWWGGGIQWLHARRQDSQTAAVNGQRPVNVPALMLKLQARYSVAAVPGLNLGADLAAQGNRTLLPDDSNPTIPGYAIVGLNGQWLQRTAGATLTWRAGIDNLFNRQGWKESPYQFGHVYLFPIPARAARVSLQVNW